MQTWTADESGAFLDYVADDRLSAAWMLPATIGMRRGEALGLHWRDVSLDHARLSMHQALVLVGNDPSLQEPKTAKGRHSIPLPPKTVAALKAHKAAQLQERLALGPDYDNSRDLVFLRQDGTWVHPTSLSRRFETLVRRASLPEIRLHDLRHTFASLCKPECRSRSSQRYSGMRR